MDIINILNKTFIFWYNRRKNCIDISQTYTKILYQCGSENVLYIIVPIMLENFTKPT